MIGVVVLRAAPYAGLGALIGAAYFAALGWNVRIYADCGAGSLALMLHFTRLGLAVAVFTLCARQGAVPLLAAFAGFLAMRTVSVNHYSFAGERNR